MKRSRGRAQHEDAQHGDAQHGDKPAALTAPEFARLMRGFGPFERKPVLAVAVSGGPDSLALCLLADAWARAKRGRIEAFTVDHRLRPESRREALQVGRWLKARGIAHRIAVWRATKPTAGLPAAAREARYRLLVEAAAGRGILHLLLAHHLDDQAETLLLRLARGSGVDGLAAMAGVVELERLRLLRPLLAVPKARLIATLRARRQDWVEDPSNQTQATARGRVRGALVREALAQEGLTAVRLGETARHLARARAALEAATVSLVARAVEIRPEGFLWIDRRALIEAPEELCLRLIARCLMTVAGEPYPPRLESLERLARAMCSKKPQRATLHGCVVDPVRDRLLVCRELAAAAPALRLDGQPVLWDGRFLVEGPAGSRVEALGARGLLMIKNDAASGAVQRALAAIPRLAALALPAICDEKGLLVVPHLLWNRAQPDRRRRRQAGKIPAYSAVFAPPAPLAPPAFAIVSAPPRPIY